MTDIKRACEAYECAAIVAANVIVNEGLSNEKNAAKIINALRDAMKKYVTNYGDYQKNTSITETPWDQYRKNAGEFIDLAKRLAGQ